MIASGPDKADTMLLQAAWRDLLPALVERFRTGWDSNAVGKDMAGSADYRLLRFSGLTQCNTIILRKIDVSVSFQSQQS